MNNDVYRVCLKCAKDHDESTVTQNYMSIEIAKDSEKCQVCGKTNFNNDGVMTVTTVRGEE